MTPATKPGPWRITLDTNPDHCNYQCTMCECFSPYSDVKKTRKGRRVMDVALVEKVLREAKEMGVREVIPSTMGEPLLYKNFQRIVDLCVELDLKLNLTTNGSWPMKGVDQWAQIILPIASDIKISWNGITQETQEGIMLGSSLARNVENLKTFLAHRDAIVAAGINTPTVTLQMTFMASNIHEIPDLISWAISLGINRIKGHHLWAHFDEIKDQDLKKDAQSIAAWNQIVTRAHEIADTNPLPHGKRIALEHFTELQQDAACGVPPESICPFLGREMWVNAIGDFNPCCAPDEQRKTLGYFGNFHMESMQEIWNSPAYQSLEKNYQEHPLCQGCNMRKVQP